MAAAVEIKGLKELRSSLKTFEKDVRQLPQKAGKEAATVVADAARPLARHQSGRLASSIRPSASGVRAFVKSNLVYSGVQHFGWPRHHISPNPFLYEALDSRGDEIVDVYVKRLEELAQKVRGA
jgi:phage gpG-like protein